MTPPPNTLTQSDTSEGERRADEIDRLSRSQSMPFSFPL